MKKEKISLSLQPPTKKVLLCEGQTQGECEVPSKSACRHRPGRAACHGARLLCDIIRTLYLSHNLIWFYSQLQIMTTNIPLTCTQTTHNSQFEQSPPPGCWKTFIKMSGTP